MKIFAIDQGSSQVASTTKELIISRGLPGSGKSTLAKELGKGGKVFSSDDFFMVNGKYQFDITFQGEAHLWNQGRVRRAMREGISPIVVDNTNVTLGEIAPYKKLAAENGYAVRYAEPNTPWKFDVDELTKRNTHNVPRDVIQRMLDKWQPTETLGMDRTASEKIDTTGFDKSNRLTQDEKDLFDILMQVVKAKSPATNVRVAGGWVRDKLMGKQPKDIDLMVDNVSGQAFAVMVTEFLGMSGPHVIRANPDQSKNLETARMYVNLPSGSRMEIDVAQARQDVYDKSSRIPTVVSATAEEDAARRDLTINSLFYSVNKDEVEDFTGKGVEDLQNHVIRTPLDPFKTFSDDPLRMLRCCRFSARYGWDISPDVAKALSAPELRERLKTKVSQERKGIELKSMLSSGYPEIAAERLIDTGIFEDLLAGAVAGTDRANRMSPVTMNQNSKHHDLNWAEHTKALARGVARKYRDKDPDKVFLVMMSAMLHDVGKLDEAGRQPKDDGTTSYHGHEDVSKDITSEFMKFVKLDQYASPVSALVGEHMRPHQLTRYDSNPAALRRFIRQMSELGIEWDDVVNLAAADSMAKGRSAEDQKAGYEKLLTDGVEFIKNMPVSKGRGVKPVINGQELMLELGLKEGPSVGEALKKVREMMDANPAITKEEVVAQLRVDMAARIGEASLVKELMNDNKFRIFKIAKADNVC